jgi:hypothetical protein
VESLYSVIREGGTERALFLLNELEEQIRRKGLRSSTQPYSAYRNTIPLDRQGPYPGDLALEERITSVIRWNALAMVVRANQAYGELGGHIASYASAAEIFEVGFNHFFRVSASTNLCTSASKPPSISLNPFTSTGWQSHKYLLAGHPAGVPVPLWPLLHSRYKPCQSGRILALEYLTLAGLPIDRTTHSWHPRMVGGEQCQADPEGIASLVRIDAQAH